MVGEGKRLLSWLERETCLTPPWNCSFYLHSAPWRLQGSPACRAFGLGAFDVQIDRPQPPAPCCRVEAFAALATEFVYRIVYYQ